MKTFSTTVFTLCLCVIFTQQQHHVSAQTSKLQVGVFYESKCPDSIRFITNQLAPVYDHLKDFIDVIFIPFGKSSSINGGQQFQCQHGPSECQGNMIQSCALNALNDYPDVQMAFVGCQMKLFAEPTGKNCANAINLDYQYIDQCMINGLGVQLQLAAEKVTQSVRYPYPKFVPTITFNGAFDQSLQDRSQNDFKTVVCQLIGNASQIC